MRKTYRENLRLTGRWGDYLARREELYAEGLDIKQARRVLESEFPVDFDGAEPAPPPAEAEEAEAVVEVAAEAEKELKPKKKGKAAPTSYSIRDFRGKLTSSIIEDVDWASQHAVFGDVELPAAPSARAYWFWQMARNPISAAEFVRFVVKMMPAKVEVDTGDSLLSDRAGLLTRIDARVAQAEVEAGEVVG